MPFLKTKSHPTTKPYNFDIECQSNSKSYDRYSFFGTKFWGGQNFLLTVAVSPRHQFISWWTRLLCVVMELAGGRVCNQQDFPIHPSPGLLTRNTKWLQCTLCVKILFWQIRCSCEYQIGNEKPAFAKMAVLWLCLVKLMVRQKIWISAACNFCWDLGIFEANLFTS